jgi:hypothetical protein
VRACLTDHDVLNLQETGLHKSSVERALMILSIAYPDMTRQQLAELSIGERDARLLTIRERIFGQHLAIFTTCPDCKQELELRIRAANLRFPALNSMQDKDEGFTTVIGDFYVRYRLPDSTDLEAMATCNSFDAAQSLLLDRCVLEIQDDSSHKGEQNTKQKELLTPAFATELASKITEQDPQSEVLLDLQCAECGHEWQSLFDIATFLWSELEIHAKRLLSEIYVLARAYHWSEQDILALSPVRRRWYMEMATT